MDGPNQSHSFQIENLNVMFNKSFTFKICQKSKILKLKDADRTFQWTIFYNLLQSLIVIRWFHPLSFENQRLVKVHPYP